MIHLFKRLIPASIARQSQYQEPTEAVTPKRQHRFERVIIRGKMQLVNVQKLPPDMPTQQDWFRIRVWQDEMHGRALTG